METRELTCIGCPLGCPVSVTTDGDNITVTGNTCAKGEAYAKKEVTNQKSQKGENYANHRLDCHPRPDRHVLHADQAVRNS